MAAAWARQVDDDAQGDLEGRISGVSSSGSSGRRPASLMDALHDRITQVADVTRSELRQQAAVLDQLVAHMQTLETRIVELAERPVPIPEPVEPDPALGRMEARLESHVAAVEEGFRQLMEWLDAPSELRTSR